MSDLRNDERRAHFLAERERLCAQLAELEAGSDTALEFDEGFADSGQVAAELGEARALARSLRDHLADLDAALAAIDAGTYGRCEACGGDIGDARLEAMPETRRCIQHA